MLRLCFLAAVGLATARSLSSVYGSSLHIEHGTVTKGQSAVEMMSSGKPFDGPKVIPINSTTFDWWYFDVVAKDASQSLTVAFYTAPKTALAFLPELDTLNFVHVSGVFPNGTRFVSIIPAQDSQVRTVGDGSSGSWEGTGFSWQGSPTLDHYRIAANNASLGYKGYIKLKSVAPAHYPCGPATRGLSEEVVPGVGWANAMPDAEGEVKFQIGDHHMSFTGYGYHDKNWGSRPFYDSVGSWYWGHARLGDYSIVWFDTLDTHETEYVSAYVSKAGKVLTHQCSGLKVRPTGDNSTYPPVVSTGSPSGYSIEIALPKGEKLLVHMNNLVLATSIGQVYERFIGNVSGTLNDVSLGHSSGLWEQFNIKESWE
ncbi:uncharacterized protein NECHADRAFT_89104 [Fusarium vanettenii 77-13-4]|uniref:AttH domain-containing protein n=1 Tax=Fusarium vanettenii (strain ATCC MYA-4622 / CBS 123669 / FGSC 9596 / NRRL 45880 / 77-13-4) TaxID=660122 RepID=C7ZQ87_FUSV7|nr:uncharacterized protein NECHADRAFT_89104 [Fusarium vanettenii 77-13-4]EEU33822.1 hypothetical protein NECHADRAFT_89104 [Fusarium vanettenii 77-13-4]